MSMGDEHVRQDCASGLECLRQRLTSNPTAQRVLLLIDEPDALLWNHQQPLLRFSNVHMVLATTCQLLMHMAESDASAGAHMAVHAAMASGLKPVPFELGPLEPLARVRLFLQRAPRPLSTSELYCKPVGPADGI